MSGSYPPLMPLGTMCWWHRSSTDKISLLSYRLVIRPLMSLSVYCPFLVHSNITTYYTIRKRPIHLNIPYKWQLVIVRTFGPNDNSIVGTVLYAWTILSHYLSGLASIPLTGQIFRHISILISTYASYAQYWLRLLYTASGQATFPLQSGSGCWSKALLFFQVKGDPGIHTTITSLPYSAL